MMRAINAGVADSSSEVLNLNGLYRPSNVPAFQLRGASRAERRDK